MDAIKDYLKQIEKELRRGDSTEHTHRPALKSLMESVMTGVVATNEPKRVECGAPDFIVTKSHVPLGYVEAKDVGKPLNDIEKSEQITRYFALGNLVLTDYLEFRWYVGGKRRLIARLAAADADGKVHEFTNGAEDLKELLQQFLTSTAASIANPKQLAERMAQLARVIRPLVADSLFAEDENGPLKQIMEGFRKVLLHDLTEEQFADMYTQTLCYGLFTAKCNHTGPDEFSRRAAQYDMPKTNPFLRDLFSHFAGPELDEQPYVWAVDDLANLLNRCDIADILENFGKQNGMRDPVVHFYETFLAAYDPKMREARGVYYTPEPVVSYIVRSVDHILKTDFGLPDGLADASKITVKNKDGKEEEVHRVQILDPATGTGTFLHGVIEQIYESFINNKGMWSGYVHDHLLPRLFGFELLMAPYAVAHLKLGLQLAETGYNFGQGERLGVYLTNTLEEAFKIQGLPFWGHRIAEEANEAGKVKRDAPVMVVLGNPPYSYESGNTGEWISTLVKDYYFMDGTRLNERNPRGLQDDYVKFIRFAQWRIEQTGYGILAFITNHGYLDNPTFCGMRRSLMNTFNEFYVLDLHGNTKKKECSPDGSLDKNVFDIQQGVAVGIFVKHRVPSQAVLLSRHAHLWGTRENNYEWLATHDVSTTVWTDLTPVSPTYTFVPQDLQLFPEYRDCWSVHTAFAIGSVGIVTSRDVLAIHLTAEDAWNIISDFAKFDKEMARIRYALGPDGVGWTIASAQADLRYSGPNKQNVTKIAYRPFDVRYTYYTGKSGGFHGRPRHEVMQHMAYRNLALLTSRMTKGESFAHVYVTSSISEKILLSPKTSNNSFHFPLYLYPKEDNPSLTKTKQPMLRAAGGLISRRSLSPI